MTTVENGQRPDIAPNRITMRPAGAPEGAKETHVTDLPTKIAGHIEKTPGAPLTVYDNRGLLEQPPYVIVGGGDLIKGVEKVFVVDGEATVSLGDNELRIQITEIGEPVTGPQTVRRPRKYVAPVVDELDDTIPRLGVRRDRTDDECL
jgi:hypothetical protein